MSSASGKSFADFDVTQEDIISTFENIMRSKSQLQDLKYIFRIALNDRFLFPNINLADGATHEEYLQRWIKGYEEATLNMPSERKAAPKSSCSDPAIKTIVQYVTKVNDVEAENQNKYHNLFMRAENIQGSLLEEYIASAVHPYGWLWCMGNVLRAVDFCTKDGKALLQIKNKSNTENSSSSAIRTDTNIQKWYRLGTRTSRGVKIPDYKWSQLNAIINNNAVENQTMPPCNMTETDYRAFLRSVATGNPRIISYS